MFDENLTYDAYLLFKEKYNSFIVDKQWRFSLMFDCFLSKNIRREVNSMIDFFSSNPTSNKVSDYLEYLRLSSLKYLKAAQNQQEIKNSWLMVREAYAYYGLGEVITEGSTYSENIIQELKLLYGNKYLTILAEIDKMAPSKLTKFSEYTSSDLANGNEVLKKYLLLKKWQDEQNIYHNQIIYPVFSKYRDAFKKEYVETYGNVDCSAREMLILSYIREMGILPIDVFSVCVDIGMRNELTTVIGGKNYGLAILMHEGFNIPKTWTMPLDSFINEESKNIFAPNKKYAVRSSALGEDGQKNSFAGMFDSILDVDQEHILAAIDEVKESCNNSRVQSYIKKFNLKQPKMSVVIQEFIEADVSGVWLGRKKNSGILEWVKGRGDQLVSGKVTPFTEIVNDNQNGALKLNERSVGEILLSFQKKLGTICDFEFCIKENQLYMLQYRPVTEIISEKMAPDDSEVIGTPASGGVVTGEVCFLDDVEEIDKFKPGSILLTSYTDPEWVEAMVKAKAIVTAEGGFLCHTAIIARELGIPCVTGIGGANLEKLSKYKSITVNGDTGGVKNSLLAKKKLIKSECTDEQNFSK